MTKPLTTQNSEPRPLQDIVAIYGDLLFDLCYQTYQDQEHAESMVRHCFRSLQGKLNSVVFERAQLFQICFQALKNIKTPFSLPLQDLWLMIFRNRYGLSLQECSIIFQTPPETLDYHFQENRKRYQDTLNPLDLQNEHRSLPLELRENPRYPSLKELMRAYRFRAILRRIPPWIQHFSSLLFTVFLVLVLVSFLPYAAKIKKHFEKRIDQELALVVPYTPELHQALQKNTSIQPSTKSNSSQNSETLHESNPSLQVDTDEEDDSSDETTSERISPYSSEIWRFIIKSDSPRVLRDDLVQKLKPESQPLEVPGGIQFDYITASTNMNRIKNEIEASIKRNSSATATTDALTWYKNKSSKPLPKNSVRIVIWISQI